MSFTETENAARGQDLGVRIVIIVHDASWPKNVSVFYHTKWKVYYLKGKKPVSFFFVGHQNFQKVLFKTFSLEFVSCYENCIFRHLFNAIINEM